MPTEPQMRILAQVALATLPARIDSDAALSRALLAQLIASGHVSAVQVAGGDEPVFVEVALTASGRAALRAFRASRPEAARTLRAGMTRSIAKLAAWAALVLLLISAGFHVLRRVAEAGGG